VNGEGVDEGGREAFGVVGQKIIASVAALGGGVEVEVVGVVGELGARGESGVEQGLLGGAEESWFLWSCHPLQVVGDGFRVLLLRVVKDASDGLQVVGQEAKELVGVYFGVLGTACSPRCDELDVLIESQRGGPCWRVELHCLRWMVWRGRRSGCWGRRGRAEGVPELDGDLLGVRALVSSAALVEEGGGEV
jgi:hypothetical protein